MNPDSRIMVFAQYRDTVDLLVDKISYVSGAKVEKLIGQSKGGLKQKEQVELLERFRKGDCNVLVSTSVGEEGLDISNTDLVIFYEPIPSEIRAIQRRGRTGRRKDGEVVMLIAINTMDEAYEKTANVKEEKMRSRLEKLNYELAKTVVKPYARGQTSLGTFIID
jgi:Fanconi anemia group M protein